MLLTVEIEQVELDDFKTGYKLPLGYVSYNVDSKYHFPGLLSVAEMTDEYTIFELPTVTDGYGNDVEVSYEGSIGVYKPYAQFLALNRDILNKYAKASYIDTTEDYSFATKEEQETLVQIDFLHDKVSEAYSISKGVRLKKIIILIFFNFQTISTLY